MRDIVKSRFGCHKSLFTLTHDMFPFVVNFLGLYLEQGNATIIDCNISSNTLTGISAISPDNSILNLQESDLISNGTFQLEMPAIGSTAHRNSVTANNTLASSGIGRSRSVLLLE